MSSIAEFTLPAESFPLGSVFEAFPNVTIELERIVPTNEAIIPYVWVRGIGDAKEQEIETTIGRHPEVMSVQLVDEVDEDYLLRMEWETDYTGILQAIAQTGVFLHSGIGDSEQWRFEIRGDERASIAAFQEYCREHDLPIQLTSLRSLARMATGAKYDLTDTQREALVLAFQRGYYQAPRETTLQEMAEDIGITGQALGARLRGGIHRLIESTLIETDVGG